MAKKNRTGLQSEVSNIFAGVPIPKRRPPRSEHPEQKPETQEPEQTAPAEKLPPEESPVQKPPEKQPVRPEVSAEKTPVPESPIVESSAPKTPTGQEQIKETPVEKMIAPQSRIEQVPVGQPPVIEPPNEQSSIAFSQDIEIPEIEEPVEKHQDLSSVKPIKSGIIEQSTVKSARKIPVISRGKRITSDKSGVSSRRQTTMVILVIALSVLLFFLLVKPFNQSSKNSARSVPNISTLPQSSFGANAESVVVDWSAPPEYPKETRDPMLPVSDQQLYLATGTPVITGISSSEGEKLAIIRGSGKLLKEGDEIFGWKVLKINPNSVVFEKEGKILELEPQGKK
jgi:hypothetical protein